MVTPLEKAIELAGGQAPLARAVGVKQAHVWNWLNRQGGVAPGYALQVSRAVGWAVTPHELRPDIYPNADDGLPRSEESGVVA